MDAVGRWASVDWAGSCVGAAVRFRAASGATWLLATRGAVSVTALGVTVGSERHELLPRSGSTEGGEVGTNMTYLSGSLRWRGQLRLVEPNEQP